jgi:serine/threonine protein kinase
MDLASLQVGDQLGRGAMGVVYRAFDPASQRQVALKVLLAGSADRFEREGVLSARLDHPSIVRVHTSGVREGRPCLVYELVEGGKTLNDLLATGCSIEEGVRLLRDTARGLGHAHARGVVHRDVKPENVLIDAEGRAKVADFGLAASKGLDQLTVTGTVLGTPLYMAPETLGGIKEQVGPPTDVWALGAILYEILAGTTPFAAESLVTLSVQVVEAPVPPIDPQRKAPAALLAVARRALEKAPEDRYPNADAFADDLDAYLRGELAAPGRGPARFIVALLAMVVLGGLFALALASQRSPETLPLPSASESPLSSALTPQASPSLADVEASTRIPDPLERYLALRRWLAEAPPDHPQRNTARRAIRRLVPRPLRSVEVGPETERITATFETNFESGGRILASAQREGTVSAWEGSKRVWVTKKTERAGTFGLPKGEALWWSVRPLVIYPYGPLGAEAKGLKVGPFRARGICASADSKTLALFCIGPNRLVIIDWPSGELRHKVPLATIPHAATFGRRGWVWVGIGRSLADSFTTMDAEVLAIDPAKGRVLHRTEIRAGSAPLSLASDPLSDEVLLGLSSGDLVRLDERGQKIASVPAFKEGDVLTRTFTAGIKNLVFNKAGDRLWVATNSLETESFLIEVDWKNKRQVRQVSLPEETETLVLSADESLLLRGTRSGKWELWATGE